MYILYIYKYIFIIIYNYYGTFSFIRFWLNYLVWL